MSPSEIIDFWNAAGPTLWFKRDAAFDAQLRARFEPAHHSAARGELRMWQASAEGALALLLLLDQIPRNLYRASAHAFATDHLAQAAAARALEAGHDQAIPLPLRVFFYLPFEHSEDIALQEQSVALFEAAGDAEFLRFAYLHRDIIARFGRFPHRNTALARESTAEEQAFLDAGGFAG